MLLIAAFVALLFASMPDVFADELVAQASIIDGDTLARIRLWSVDAPESGAEMVNAPADEAANDLDAFIGHQPIACVELDRDQSGRSVAVCTVAGIDLAEWLVKNGLALDWPKDSQGQRRCDAERGQARWPAHLERICVSSSASILAGGRDHHHTGVAGEVDRVDQGLR